MINSARSASVWGRVSVAPAQGNLVQRVTVGETPVSYEVFVKDPGLAFLEKAKRSPKFVVFTYIDGRVKILAIYRHVNRDMAFILNQATSEGPLTIGLLRSYNPSYLAK